MDQSIRPLYSSGTVPKKTGFFGLSLKASMVAMGGAVLALISAVFIGPKVGLVLAIITVASIAPMAITVRGRSIYEMAEILMQWLKRKHNGSTVYRSGPHSRIPGGLRPLPGVLSEMTLHEWSSDGLGNPFGILHLKRFNEYTIVLECHPGGDEALTVDEMNIMTAEWGRYIAQLSLPGDIVAATVVVESVPSSGQRLFSEVESEIVPTAPDLAAEVMYQSAEIIPSGQTSTFARLSITFKAMNNETRQDWEAMAAELANRLPAFYRDLLGAGVQALPMSAADIVSTAHRAYVPEAEYDLETASIHHEDTGLTWDTCGPTTAVTEWDKYRHAGGVSVVWEMTTAPESVFTDEVLRPLLAPHDGAQRKRIALFYRPVKAGDATRIVDKEYKDSLTALNTGKAVKSAAAEMRLQATEQARDEQVRGAGLALYSMLLSITEPSIETVPSASAILESLSTQSRLGIQRAYAFQDIAFAASLGLGVLLPDHVSTNAVGKH